MCSAEMSWHVSADALGCSLFVPMRDPMIESTNAVVGNPGGNTARQSSAIPSICIINCLQSATCSLHEEYPIVSERSLIFNGLSGDVALMHLHFACSLQAPGDARHSGRYAATSVPCGPPPSRVDRE